MDPPFCHLCERHHYGRCSAAVVPTEPRVRKSAKKPATKAASVADATIVALLARVESLEARVLELESRKRYMRKYMAEKRERKNEPV